MLVRNRPAVRGCASTDAETMLTPPHAIDPTGEALEIYDLDVTGFVLSDYANDGNNPWSAFRLQVSEATFVDDDESNFYQFTATRGAFAPELVLTFIPEPTSIMLLVCSTLGLAWAVRRRAG